MKRNRFHRVSSRFFFALALGTLASCASSARWHLEDGLAAESVELQVDGNGRVLEIEYHVKPESVPANVHAAMNELHPGGSAVGAEKEYVDGVLYWELTKLVDGLEHEAMFLPDGTLHSEENEVRPASVPTFVRDAVVRRLGGAIDKWEEIRDGSRALVEYHAKVSADGKRYKVAVSTEGEVLLVVREVEAEIELPVEGS